LDLSFSLGLKEFLICSTAKASSRFPRSQELDVIISIPSVNVPVSFVLEKKTSTFVLNIALAMEKVQVGFSDIQAAVIRNVLEDIFSSNKQRAVGIKKQVKQPTSASDNKSESELTGDVELKFSLPFVVVSFVGPENTELNFTWKTVSAVAILHKDLLGIQPLMFTFTSISLQAVSSKNQSGHKHSGRILHPLNNVLHLGRLSLCAAQKIGADGSRDVFLALNSDPLDVCVDIDLFGKLFQLFSSAIPLQSHQSSQEIDPPEKNSDDQKLQSQVNLSSIYICLQLSSFRCFLPHPSFSKAICFSWDSVGLSSGFSCAGWVEDMLQNYLKKNMCPTCTHNALRKRPHSERTLKFLICGVSTRLLLWTRSPLESPDDIPISTNLDVELLGELKNENSGLLVEIRSQIPLFLFNLSKHSLQQVLDIALDQDLSVFVSNTERVERKPVSRQNSSKLKSSIHLNIIVQVVDAGILVSAVDEETKSDSSFGLNLSNLSFSLENDAIVLAIENTFARFKRDEESLDVICRNLLDPEPHLIKFEKIGHKLLCQVSAFDVLFPLELLEFVLVLFSDTLRKVQSKKGKDVEEYGSSSLPQNVSASSDSATARLHAIATISACSFSLTYLQPYLQVRRVLRVEWDRVFVISKPLDENDSDVSLTLQGLSASGLLSSSDFESKPILRPVNIRSELVQNKETLSTSLIIDDVSISVQPFFLVMIKETGQAIQAISEKYLKFGASKSRPKGISRSPTTSKFGKSSALLSSLVTFVDNDEKGNFITFDIKRERRFSLTSIDFVGINDSLFGLSFQLLVFDSDLTWKEIVNRRVDNSPAGVLVPPATIFSKFWKLRFYAEEKLDLQSLSDQIVVTFEEGYKGMLINLSVVLDKLDLEIGSNEFLSAPNLGNFNGFLEDVLILRLSDFHCTALVLTDKILSEPLVQATLSGCFHLSLYDYANLSLFPLLSKSRLSLQFVKSIRDGEILKRVQLTDVSEVKNEMFVKAELPALSFIVGRTTLTSVEVLVRQFTAFDKKGSFRKRNVFWLVNHSGHDLQVRQEGSPRRFTLSRNSTLPLVWESNLPKRVRVCLPSSKVWSLPFCIDREDLNEIEIGDKVNTVLLPLFRDTWMSDTGLSSRLTFHSLVMTRNFTSMDVHFQFLGERYTCKAGETIGFPCIKFSKVETLLQDTFWLGINAQKLFPYNVKADYLQVGEAQPDALYCLNSFSKNSLKDGGFIIDLRPVMVFQNSTCLDLSLAYRTLFSPEDATTVRPIRKSESVMLDDIHPNSSTVLQLRCQTPSGSLEFHGGIFIDTRSRTQNLSGTIEMKLDAEDKEDSWTLLFTQVRNSSKDTIVFSVFDFLQVKNLCSDGLQIRCGAFEGFVVPDDTCSILGSDRSQAVQIGMDNSWSDIMNTNSSTASFGVSFERKATPFVFHGILRTSPVDKDSTVRMYIKPFLVLHNRSKSNIALEERFEETVLLHSLKQREVKRMNSFLKSSFVELKEEKTTSIHLCMKFGLETLEKEILWCPLFQDGMVLAPVRRYPLLIGSTTVCASIAQHKGVWHVVFFSDEQPPFVFSNELGSVIHLLEDSSSPVEPLSKYFFH
jgi:hypothetical protein